MGDLQTGLGVAQPEAGSDRVDEQHDGHVRVGALRGGFDLLGVRRPVGLRFDRRVA